MKNSRGDTLIGLVLVSITCLLLPIGMHSIREPLHELFQDTTITVIVDSKEIIPGHTVDTSSMIMVGDVMIPFASTSEVPNQYGIRIDGEFYIVSKEIWDQIEEGNRISLDISLFGTIHDLKKNEYQEGD